MQGFVRNMFSRPSMLRTIVMVLAVAVCWQVSTAQVKKGKTRILETKYMMKGLVGNSTHAVSDLLKEAGPADDAAWDKVVCHAQLLNESACFMMDDGRCPDAVWAGACKTLKDCSAALVDAAKAKKLDDTKAAFKGMTGSCAACHAAHKK